MLSRDQTVLEVPGQTLKSLWQAILDFEAFVYSDKENADESVSKVAVALIGDVASTLAGVGQLFQQKPHVQNFIQECTASADPSLAESANWAAAALRKAMATAA